MRMLNVLAVLAALGSASVVEAQPAVVTLGPAGAGTREIGFSYAGWSFNADRSGSAGAARYTYNLSDNVGVEGGIEIGSAAHRPFGNGTLQARIMGPSRPFVATKFFTVGVVRAMAPRAGSPAPRGWGRSLGLGMLQPVSDDVAIRVEGQVLMFGEHHTGLRIAATIVAGR